MVQVIRQPAPNLRGEMSKELEANDIHVWHFQSCEAQVGVGKDWATIYTIRSMEPGKGHATTLMLAMKKYYEGQGLKFGGSVALNDRMCRLYRKCGVKEYTSL